MEAQKHGYWVAEDKEIEELTEKYLELEGDIEDNTLGL